MSKVVRGIVAMAASMALVAAWSAPAVAQLPSCATAPTYDSRVPTPQSVLGFPLGIGQPQPVTGEQIVRYVQAVDAASDRVISFDIGTTWGGRPLKVAIVSSREHMRPAELRRIRERFVAVREGRDDSLRGSPAPVWLAGNVHGGEKSGADAELRVLYELAARTDCEASKLNDDLVTVIMPSQNPDGREASRRQNDYGFDLNRDWFARTQPETEAKVELLRRWPGQVFVDAHEMGGRQYFFPPNADPIHHEIADEPVAWINGIGEANKAAFGYNGACSDTITEECYFNYDVYDMFFMGYGDTVPATGFGAAGMTYEKGNASPTLGEDPYVPFPYFYDVSSWSNPLLMGVPTLYTGDRVRPWAVRVRGPEGGVQRRRARRTRSYQYSLDSSQAGALTFRLLDRGVALRRDTERNVVSLAARNAPRGLSRLARELGVDVKASRRRAEGERVPLRSLGLLAGAGISTTSGSHGESRYVIEQRWERPVTTVTAADVNAGAEAFRELEALIVPDGSDPTGGLTAQGQQNLRDWVAAGGVLVGLRRAHNVARSAGLTSTTVKAPPEGYLVLGSHFRVDVDDASPVALGRPREDFQFNNDDPLLNPSTTGVNVLTYPTDGRFWFNGYTENADALKGTVALTDEPFGQGHVVLFAYNPVFRAYEESGEHLLANALLYPTGGPALTTLRRETVDGTSRAARPDLRRAETQAPARDLGGSWRAIRLSVSEPQSAAALAVVRRYAEPAAVERSRGNVVIVLANPGGLQADEHPFARNLLRALRAEGVQLRSAVL